MTIIHSDNPLYNLFAMKNPNWHKDEIILALELYFSPDRGSLDSRNPKVIALSKLLNSLPLFDQKPDELKFRNNNGVAYKLANFRYFDKSEAGKGMQNGSKMDKALFDYFQSRLSELKEVAKKIREIAANAVVAEKIKHIEEDFFEEISVWEGQSIYKMHKVVERDRKIVDQKKKQVKNKLGKLNCEVCDFNFSEAYGDLGIGFIECHHKLPLAELKISVQTKLEDLALVCSNCHRMLHRKIELLSVDDLKFIFKKQQIKYKKK